MAEQQNLACLLALADGTLWPGRAFGAIGERPGEICFNILRLLAAHNCRVTIGPAQTSTSDILALKPDGVFLSGGPGDPAAVTYAIDHIKQLLGRVPIFGICLGHQLLGLALGGKTYKLKGCVPPHCGHSPFNIIPKLHPAHMMRAICLESLLT